MVSRPSTATRLGSEAGFCCESLRMFAQASFQEGSEFIHREAGEPNQLPQGAAIQLPVERNREIDVNTRLYQGNVTSFLSSTPPPRALESLESSPSLIPPEEVASDGYLERPRVRRQRPYLPLGFRLQPKIDGLSDVLNCLSLGTPLTNATWQGRALGDDPSIFARFQNYFEGHSLRPPFGPSHYRRFGRITQAFHDAAEQHQTQELDSHPAQPHGARPGLRMTQ